MALFENVEIWHIRLDKDRPNAAYNKTNPTWEIQMRTKDKDQAQAWRDGHLKVHAHRDTEDGPLLYWRVNLRKKSIKEKDRSNNKPVACIDGNMEPVDPNTVGNGSIANVRTYQYDYDNKDGKGIATVLMGIQLIKHIVYTPKPRVDEFKATQTERIVPPSEETGGSEDDADSKDEGFVAQTPSPASITVGAKTIVPPDETY